MWRKCKILTCFDLKGNSFELGLGGDSVVDAARDRQFFRDDPDALPVEVFEEGHERRHEGGLVTGNGAHEGRVDLLILGEVAEPLSGAGARENELLDCA